MNTGAPGILLTLLPHARGSDLQTPRLAVSLCSKSKYISQCLVFFTTPILSMFPTPFYDYIFYSSIASATLLPACSQGDGPSFHRFHSRCTSHPSQANTVAPPSSRTALTGGVIQNDMALLSDLRILLLS
ncbi:hypothetical protein BJV74DRAFT_817910 [Russula compacta]|nr:hypothetical protein BJV74DRAFT_817910 [Russula compacta]